MSFNEVMAELPLLTVEQRQLLIRQALELDDAGLSSGDKKLVEERRAEYHAHLQSALSLEEMESRLRAKFGR